MIYFIKSQMRVYAFNYRPLRHGGSVTDHIHRLPSAIFLKVPESGTHQPHKLRQLCSWIGTFRIETFHKIVCGTLKVNVLGRKTPEKVSHTVCTMFDFLPYMLDTTQWISQQKFKLLFLVKQLCNRMHLNCSSGWKPQIFFCGNRSDISLGSM